LIVPESIEGICQGIVPVNDVTYPSFKHPVIKQGTDIFQLITYCVLEKSRQY